MSKEKRNLRIAFDFVDENRKPCDENLSFLNTFEVALNDMKPMQRIQFAKQVEKVLLKAIDCLTQMEEINHPIVLSPSKALMEQDDKDDTNPKLLYEFVHYGSIIETRKSSYHENKLRRVE